MRGKYQRMLGSRVAALQSHSVTARVELVECSIGVPRLVEMQHVDCVLDLTLNHLGVVAESVIGRVGDDSDAQAVVLARERICLDSLRDIIRRELVETDRTDNSIVVSR